ncbi:MAG: serine/threonine-protein kinase [Bradymonadia bacterium]
MQHTALLNTVIEGRYRLDEILGHGASGVVFKAAQIRLHDRPCALKVLRLDSELPQGRARFARELKIITEMRSPYIVDVLDSGALEDGSPFIVMQLLNGQTVDDYIKTAGPLSPTLAVTLAVQILEGLKVAHRSGVIHRDLKPANVFLNMKDGVITHGSILDFGLAKHIGPDAGPALTEQGMVVGTPTYMAPEQFLREPVDAQADLYAAGCLLYCMLAGRSPFRMEDPLPPEVGHLHGIARVAWLHINQAPPPIAGLSPALWSLVESLLAKRPMRRSPDAETARLALMNTPEFRQGPRGASTDPDTTVMDPEQMAEVLGMADHTEDEDDEASTPWWVLALTLCALAAVGVGIGTWIAW